MKPATPGISSSCSGNGHQILHAVMHAGGIA
jgi:hypothetical protein